MKRAEHTKDGKYGTCPHCRKPVIGHKKCKSCTILIHDGETCDCTTPRNYYKPTIY